MEHTFFLEYDVEKLFCVVLCENFGSGVWCHYIKISQNNKIV